MNDHPTTPIAETPSPLRAWIYLVGFAFRQMSRFKQMVGIAVGLLLLTCLVTSLITFQFGWHRTEHRSMQSTLAAIQWVGGSMTVPSFENSTAMEAVRRENKPLTIFSRWVIFFLFLGFLLPLWSLSFASSALGADRENRSLIWLLTRPLPRSGIYLAKFLAVLPWCLAMNLGGYACICLCGGETGRQALPLYWPAIAAGTLAFAAVFHLIAALFSRPTIVGLLYAFFFETILSELPVPGTVKRFSINYYTRCLMYSAASTENVPVESDALFVPVSNRMAWLVLLGATAVITAVGMWWFARSEQRDD